MFESMRKVQFVKLSHVYRWLLCAVGLYCSKKKNSHGEERYVMSWPLLFHSALMHCGFLACAVGQLDELQTNIGSRPKLALRTLACTLAVLDAIRTGPKYDVVLAKLGLKEDTLRREAGEESGATLAKLCLAPLLCRAILLGMLAPSQSTRRFLFELYSSSVFALNHWKICDVFLKLLRLVRKLNGSLAEPQFLGLTLKQKCLFRIDLEELFKESLQCIECALFASLSYMYITIFAWPYDVAVAAENRGFHPKISLAISDMALKFIMLSYLSTELGRELGRTWNVITDLNESDRASKEMKGRVLEIVLRSRVQVAPFSFFVLGPSFLLVVITSSLKYAMVLMQFDSSQKPSISNT